MSTFVGYWFVIETESSTHTTCELARKDALLQLYLILNLQVLHLFSIISPTSKCVQDNCIYFLFKTQIKSL